MDQNLVPRVFTYKRLSKELYHIKDYLHGDCPSTAKTPESRRCNGRDDDDGLGRILAYCIGRQASPLSSTDVDSTLSGVDDDGEGGQGRGGSSFVASSEIFSGS